MTAACKFTSSVRSLMPFATFDEWLSKHAQLTSDNSKKREDGRRRVREETRATHTFVGPITEGMKRRRRKQSAKAKCAVDKELYKIEAASRKGDDHRLKELVLRFLTSFSARLVAYERARKNMKQRCRPHLYNLSAYARSLDVFQLEFEPATISLKARMPGDGRLRPITSFGIHHRARQQLVLMLLEVCLPLRAPENFYSIEGRSNVDAVQTVADKMLDPSITHCAEVDITEFFATFGEEYGRASPENTLYQQLTFLPRAVVESCILASGVLYFDHHDAKEGVNLSNAWTGVPQGSVVSSYLAQVIAGSIISSLVTDVNPIVYADNFVLLGDSADEVHGQINLLEIAAAKNRFGKFRFKVSRSVRKKEQGLITLGHYLRYDEIDQGRSRAVIEVADKNKERFSIDIRTLVDRLTQCENQITFQKLEVKLMQKYSGWVESFRLVSDAENIASAIVLSELRRRRRQLGGLHGRIEAWLRGLTNRLEPS